MTKDPFFALKPDLRAVSNIHRAVAVPECSEDGTPIALDITVQGSINVISVPATIGCNGWTPAEPVPLDPTISSAQQVAAWGFASDEGVVVLRSEDGTFDRDSVEWAIQYNLEIVWS